MAKVFSISSPERSKNGLKRLDVPKQSFSLSRWPYKRERMPHPSTQARKPLRRSSYRTKREWTRPWASCARCMGTACPTRRRTWSPNGTATPTLRARTLSMPSDLRQRTGVFATFSTQLCIFNEKPGPIIGYLEFTISEKHLCGVCSITDSIFRCVPWL
jgi:hypothetical protein